MHSRSHTVSLEAMNRGPSVLAAELGKRLGIKTEFVESSGEVFEVEYGGKLLFSKRHVGRFPIEGEILDLIKLTTHFRDVGNRRRVDEDTREQ
jgi:selenoprotein W-related protein